MRLTPRTPRAHVRRFLWAVIGHGGTLTYRLGGKPLLARWCRAWEPTMAGLIAEARRELAMDAGVSGA